jgi:MFS family permease
MKNMSVETGAAGAFFAKFGFVAGAGMAGAAIMAVLDPPKTRKELFLQGMCAGVGSIVFGPAALSWVAGFLGNALVTTNFADWALPVYFLVGALSWGCFGMLVKLRVWIAEKGADKIADKVE